MSTQETPKATPQAVVDAIRWIAVYLEQHSYSDCLITPGGGASFSRGDNHLTRLINYANSLTAFIEERDDLLAALDAVTAERDRYRAALIALVGDDPPLDHHWDDAECAYCDAYWSDPHEADCPWALARAALAPPAAGEPETP